MKVGIDFIESEKVSLDEKFLNKICLADEKEYIFKNKCERGQRQRVAALWSVKEAVMKALGLGRESKVAFKDIQLCHEECGRPYVLLFGQAQKAFKTQNLTEIEVSISHSDSGAVAICIVK